MTRIKGWREVWVEEKSRNEEVKTGKEKKKNKSFMMETKYMKWIKARNW